MDKSIYSLVLSDKVVEAVDDLANAAGLSRSAMINRILAERVAYTTPEMRLGEIFSAMQRAMNDGFYYLEQPSAGTLSCRTALKYRYKPTVRYSVEIFSRGGRKAGELRVSFRTQNEQLISDLMGFFRCWAALEQRYIASKLSQDIIYTIDSGKFTRTLNMPERDIGDEQLGRAVADYMAMFDAAMKQYFSYLPDADTAARAAEQSYAASVVKQKVII
ncbi:MAG: ribbon-helix-helix protein, CopG family [Ruminococcaceae bacterium]|nr:ribbon-helix-helix protein, CopG family [Oscillospiraceae bacterium]